MKKTPQQIKNLRDALVWWKTVPKENVNLDTWRDSGTPPYTCNTIACFGGWCAVQPLLVAQGVFPDGNGIPQMEGINWPANVALRIFGDYFLFSAHGCHPADGDTRSHHKCVTKRIKAALADPEQT